MTVVRTYGTREGRCMQGLTIHTKIAIGVA